MPEHGMIPPILALVAWTFVLWVWMYATRIPAMRDANVDVAELSRTGGKLAWAYVAARVVHSLVQATRNVIPIRFALFALGSLILLALLVRTALRLA